MAEKTTLHFSMVCHAFRLWKILFTNGVIVYETFVKKFLKINILRTLYNGSTRGTIERAERGHWLKK